MSLRSTSRLVSASGDAHSRRARSWMQLPLSGCQRDRAELGPDGSAGRLGCGVASSLSRLPHRFHILGEPRSPNTQAPPPFEAPRSSACRVARIGREDPGGRQDPGGRKELGGSVGRAAVDSQHRGGNPGLRGQRQGYCGDRTGDGVPSGLPGHHLLLCAYQPVSVRRDGSAGVAPPRLLCGQHHDRR
jgi:hypothetical protein